MESKQFARQKEQCLSGVDLSRKGSVDASIVDLVNFINSQPDCFTTSSCSGRIIIVDNTDDKGEVQKRGCQWLYVTHDEACFSDMQACLSSVTGAAVFKFEPMVMHIQVQSVEVAQRVHAVAVASGFRNSGITIGGKGKIIVAVRSTHSLEAPLSCSGTLLVTEAYIEHLVLCANKKMQENLSRISRFFDNLKAKTESSPEKGAKRKQKKHEHCHQSLTEETKSDHSTEIIATKDNSLGTEVPSDHTHPANIDGVEECFDSLLFEET